MNKFKAQVGIKPPPISVYKPPGQANADALKPFQDVMKLVSPGMLQDTHPSSPKAKSAPSAKKSGPSKAAVVRRITQQVPAGPPVDPLDTLQKEYAGYLTGAYGGLETALGADAEQYKKRSQEIADRIKAQYADAQSLASGMNDASKNALAEYAQRMGLQEATQGSAVQDWFQQNERLKALNSAAQANSMSTNDIIRSNYYDFLVDRIASARGAEATSQATLLDTIANAKLQRLQAQQAAAAAAARRRSGGGRGGGGSGGGSGSTKAGQKSTSTNDAMAEMYRLYPELRDVGMADYKPSADLLAQARKLEGSASGNLNPRVSSQVSPQTSAQIARLRQLAQDIFYAGGPTGGPRMASTVTYK